MKYRLFASSYTGGKPGDGIYALEFDGEQLRCRDVCAELVNPSYIQPDGDRLFAVEETENGAVSYTHLDVYKRQVYGCP